MAAHAARLSVMPLQREGGQAQFIAHESAATAGSLQPVLDWLARSPQTSPSLEQMAKYAGMSPRTFARRFVEQTGTTPLPQRYRASFNRL